MEIENWIGDMIESREKQLEIILSIKEKLKQKSVENISILIEYIKNELTKKIEFTDFEDQYVICDFFI